MTTQRHDVFIDCPFSDKDEAKALGARFHSGRKSWFVSAGTALEPFRKWLPMDVLRDVAPEEAPEEKYGPSPDNAPQLRRGTYTGRMPWMRSSSFVAAVPSRG